MPLARWLLAAALVVAPLVAHSAALTDTKVVTENSSEDTEASSGDASSSNSSSGFVGHSAEGDTGASSTDFENSSGTNLQDGDNELQLNQESNVQTGAGVTGQVIGAVVAGGDLTIDATNVSEDTDVETGDATGENNAVAFIGLLFASDTSLDAADFENVVGTNLQEGDNQADFDQSVDVSSGEGVAGQVIGAVVQDGTTDIAASNRSEDVDIETGDADGSNDLSAFVGLNKTTSTVTLVADFETVTAVNAQEGDNTFDADQSVEAVSGDGVGGQVLAAVSGGDTTIDASNASLDVDIRTGDADGTNDAAVFAGLLVASDTDVSPADFTSVTGTNLQDGDNLSELRQTADATSGDAVAGQVAGVVNPRGSTDVVLSNVSKDADLESGVGTIANVQLIFTGLNVSTGSVTLSDSESPLRSIFAFPLS